MEVIMTYVQPFFEWLLQTTLIASVVICLILAAQKTLGGKLGPRWSHALWLVLLIRMVLPWSPSSRFSLFNLIPSWDRQIQRQQLFETTEQQDVSQPAQTAGTSEARPGQKPQSEIAIQERVAPQPRTLADVQSESKPQLVSVRRVLPLFWLAGAMVIGAYLLVSDLALWRIVKREGPLVNQEMLELFEKCKAQMVVQTLVAVVPSDQIRSPALFGFIRPRLLLPREMLEKAGYEEMRYVFLHELAHLKRRDIYVGWLTSFLQVLHWFNPLVWFAFYLMRSDRELACDALVLARTQKEESQEYGRAIVGLLRRFSRSQRLPAMAGILENKSQLKRRITMIARFKKNSYQWSPLAVILIILLACVSLPNAKRTKASGISAEHSARQITLRQVRSGPFLLDLLGAPSPDGRYLSHVDWETGDLAISEIATGNKRRLTNKGPWDESDECADASRWSPDGKQIAYCWERGKDSVDLRVIGLDGSEPRTLYSTGEQKRWIEPCAWFPDGKQILVHLTGKDGTDQIVQISAADRSLRVLKTVGKDCLGYVRFSPDGQYIAYDSTQEEDPPNHDITVISTDGTREISLVKHPAHDSVLGWAPDGKSVLFASDRTGIWGIWLIAVADGKPQGAPELIKPDIGDFEPLGFTQKGSFYYGTSRGNNDIYVATLDPQTGRILASPEKATLRYEGSNITSAYSPDGKYLAYLCEPFSLTRQRSPRNILCIRSLETGKERHFTINLHLFRVSIPRWSPDCRTLLVGGTDGENREGLFQIDAQTGDIKPLMLSEGEISFRAYDWARDGKAVFYARGNGQLLVRDLENGKEKELCPSSSSEYYTEISVSPDGKWLALRSQQHTDVSVRSLKVMSVTGEERRELYRFEKGQYISSSTWTTDGGHVLFASKVPGKNDWELCRIPAKGGQVQKLGPDMVWFSWINSLSVHPDGRHIAFQSSGPKRKFGEVWVMENFLPAAPAAKPEPKPGISLRRIKTGPMSDFSSPPSLDGRYLCDLGRRDAQGNQSLVVRDLVTGDIRALTEVSEGFPWSPVISPESKHVAYVRQSWSPPKSELQLIRMDGTGHRVLYRLEQDERFHIRAWTPDGKKILGAFKKGSESLQLVAFSIEDGSMQVIYTFDTYWPLWQSPLHKLAISPNGRYIAYDRPPEKGSWNAEIYILDIERQRAECVVQHPAYDKLLGWTQDGNYIFFKSDRRQGLPGGFTVTDSSDAYLLPVAEGRRQGAPVLIKRDIPDKIRPKGFTRDGAYYYTIEFKTIEAVVAKLDLQTGNMLKKPQAVGQTGADQIPAWSPDGRYLAYCVHKLNKSQTIRIQNLETSQERELDPNLPHFSWLRWSHDGKSFLVSNFNKKLPQAIYRINASTGERVAVVQAESSDTLLGEPQLSPDGSTLFYVLRNSDSKKASLMIRDTESSREKELFSLDGTRDKRSLTFALSPDGRQLALKTNKFTSSGTAVVSRILTMPAKGGEPKELWKTEGQITRPTIAWTPDGQSLLFPIRIPEGGRELWLIPAGGGQARKLCTPQEMRLPEMMYGGLHSALDVHPDGQRIAFDCFEYRHEVWVMENFLPAAPVDLKNTRRVITQF